MKYLVRIKNDMFGYDNDRVVLIEADSDAEAIAAGKKLDCYAQVSIETQKEQKMTYDDIDNLVKQELQGSIRSLCDTILQYDLDYEDSVITLDGMITALDYYSPHSEFITFIATLPDEILDILNPPETLVERMDDGICIATEPDSPLAQNLQLLGFQVYMAMADLGFVTLETLINAAKLQLQGNGSKV